MPEMAAFNLNQKRWFCCCNWKTVFHGTQVVLLSVFVFSSVFRADAAQTYPTFQIPDSDSQFQNHFLDTRTDTVYVGALNNIYRLSSELSLESSISTGPVQDNQLCRPPPFSCEHKRTTTDHHNKVIFEHQNRLITCGNIYQGTCDIRDPVSLNVIYGESIREVVPNTLSGLAVAFVADAEGDQVMYVASSHGRWLRGSELPTVSTRLIDNTVEENKLFKVSSDNAEVIIPLGTINNSPEERIFNISYIYGFSSGQFSYFVASQPSDHATLSKLTSKLVRLCQGDPDFISYIELPLVCATDSDTEYNLVQSAHLANLSLGGNKTREVLVAAFSKSETEISDTLSSVSAVCIFPVEDINLAFYERRINCAQQGTHNTDINWLGSAPCRISQPLVDAIRSAGPDGYCHIIDTMNPLGGDIRDITISSTPVYESSSHITAVAAVQHFETYIIFVGDSDGRLRTLRVDDALSAVEYNDHQLHQTPVIRNGLLLSEDKEFVFVISEDQITKVPVEECHEYTTCEECHAAQDPYCGWCSLQAECTRRLDAECTGSENGTSPRWLSTDKDCLAITSVTPEYALAETTTELTVEIASLPPIPNTGILRCVFMEGGSELGKQPVVVTSDMSNIKCNTPADITAINQGFRMIELQIHYEENGQSVNIAATEFDFYDCTKLSSCSLCAGNKYDCHWCLYSNKCKDSTQNCSNTDIGSAHSCPRILQMGEILIPAGQRQSIEIDGENFPDDTFSYGCRISFSEQDQLTTPANVARSGKIVCHNTLFNYSSSEESKSGTLQVYWGDFSLDMEDDITVTLYKCDQMAETIVGGFIGQTCAKCLTIDLKYLCRWCPDINRCLSPSNEGTCQQDQQLSGDMDCPNPTIVSVFPLSGHITGGARLAIEGYNLGLDAEDVETVTVAGVNCAPMEFLSSQKLYCTTTSVPSPTSGKVIVQFNSRQIPAAISDHNFSYVIPRVLEVFPSKGPQSGGTRLVVKGRYLDAGLLRKVEISSNPCTNQIGYLCEEIESNNEEIICRSSPGNITNGTVAVTFDLGCETGGNVFNYREDPVVDSFEKLTSIVSGGLELTISGDYFDIIQEAFMVFRIEDETFQTECYNRSSKLKLFCITPSISSIRSSLPISLPAENVSLYMDGVTTYKDLGPSFPGTRREVFTFYSDPVYYQLPSGEKITRIQQKEQRDREVKVQGDNLTLASSLEDVTVKIGTWDCLVYKLTNKEVTCRPDPPNLAPGIYDVVVRHGSLQFKVGQIEYWKTLLSSSTLVNVILSGVLFLVLLVLVVTLVCCCRRAHARREENSESTLNETKESKVKHSYFSEDPSGNTSRMSLQGVADDASEHIYFGDEMDYMSISSNRRNETKDGSRNIAAFEEDEMEETVLEKEVPKKEGVSTPDTIAPMEERNVTEDNETLTANDENESLYNRNIVHYKPSTNEEDRETVVAVTTVQESNTADGVVLGDDALETPIETGFNQYSEHIYAVNKSSECDQSSFDRSRYSARIYLDRNKISTQQ